MKKYRAVYQAVEHKKNQDNYKLKQGITWEQVDQAKADGTFKISMLLILKESELIGNKI